ncbi:hypothetical protein GXP71_09750 [Cellulomonas sp. H30R-01]|uniref:N-acetylmuramoyl-L-alanine amidase n=1 Tax=Cellulomonas sp. H30R-01 TaxID=2704467 RepID=UPI00138BB53D|nr:N-acetylmuramoyl-L-alanine amidase [Cellulomonas sp. H30R-01]QHT56333.1 hypothetical protein GXP71_09750 [Cellulomonas sp. H30R-01]
MSARLSSPGHARADRRVPVRRGRLRPVVVGVLGVALLLPAAGTLPAAAAPAPAAAPAAPAPAELVDLAVDEVPVAVAGTPAPTDGVAEPEVSAALPDVVVADEVGARAVTDSVPVDPYQTLGVTWSWTSAPQDVEVSVRTRTDGEWSGWVPLESDGVAPDPGTAEAARDVRAGTESVWIGGAEDVQLSFGAGAEAAQDVRLALVGPVDEARTATTGDTTDRSVDRSSRSTARAATAVLPAVTTPVPAAVTTAVAQPAIITREGWGAAPQRCTLDVASTLLATVVHHTAGPNTYSTVEQAMAQIRGDQQYHQDARGWCDIGYNFLVDKWGNIYEGRDNSGTQPVIGVHAGGFNTATVGISMLGDYSSITPSAGVQESVARLIAWRMASYHRDPGSTIGYTTLGGENSRYPAGTWLALPVVIGHRDVAFTACPGERGYAVLGAIKQRARDLIGGQIVNPALTATSIPVGGSVSVNGGTTSTMAWTLRVVDERTGVLVRTVTGATPPSGGTAIATWNGRNDAGTPVGPGPYRLTLDVVDAANGSPAVGWTGRVDVTGTSNPPTVPSVPLTGDLRFVPVTPTRLLDTRPAGASLGAGGRVDLTVAGVAGVPADAKAVALNVTAVAPSAMTFVRVWPAGGPMPSSSTFNADPRLTAASGVLVGVGGQGKVSLYNNSGSTHLVVDVSGYFVDGSSGVGYEPLPAGARMIDTRSDGGALSAGTTRTVQVTGRGGVPAGATAVLANVSSVMPGGVGNVIAYPAGGTVPTIASVNHLPGDNVSNRTVVPLSADGRLALTLQGARADVVVDVIGWFGPSATQRFTPIDPARAADTRASSPLQEGEARDLPLGSVALPAQAKSAVLSLAATQQTAPMTFLTAWRPGTARPTASDLNTGRGRDQAAMTVVPLGSDRQVRVYNDKGSSQVIVDVQGWFG